MKILSIGTDRDLFVAGSAVAGRQIARGEKVGQLHIIVFTLRSLGLEARDLSAAVLIIPTNSRSRWFYVWDAVRIAKTLSYPDLITAQDPFECGLAGWLAARYHRTRLELQIHTDFLSPYFSRHSCFNWIRVKLARFLLPRASEVRVVSKRILDSLNSSGCPLKVVPYIQPIVVDTEKIKAAPIIVDLKKKYPQFEKIILMASRLAPEKNISLALAAMVEVIKVNPGVGLVIVGSGSELPDLKLKVKQWKLVDNVVFEPWVEKPILWSYAKTADFFLLTSLYEGYGLALLEARAAGCNIISTDVGVAREIGAQIVDWKAESVAQKIILILKR